MNIKVLYKKIVFYCRLILAGEYEKARIYNKYLDVKFGKNVRIIHFPRFGSEPYLIEIGNNVTITRGVSFVNHDGGVGLLRQEYPGINIYGKIIIGNNVFIGINSIIFPNVCIGDNAVIGAGSVVTKNIPSNSVAAGVPAKVIKSFDEYKEQVLRKAVYITEKDLALRKKLILKSFTKLKNSV